MQSELFVSSFATKGDSLLGLECGSKCDSKCRAKADAESNSKADVAEYHAQRYAKRDTHAHTEKQSDEDLARRRLLGRIALTGARFNRNWGEDYRTTSPSAYCSRSIAVAVRQILRHPRIGRRR